MRQSRVETFRNEGKKNRHIFMVLFPDSVNPGFSIELLRKLLFIALGSNAKTTQLFVDFTAVNNHKISTIFCYSPFNFLTGTENKHNFNTCQSAIKIIKAMTNITINTQNIFLT